MTDKVPQSFAMSQPKKRYLITDTLDTKLHDDFIYSRYRKFIHICWVKLIINDDRIMDDIEAFDQPKGITYHSNIVDDYRYLDSMIGFVNENEIKRPKYEQFAKKDRIYFWLYDRDGTRLDSHNLTREKNYYIHKINDSHSRKIRFTIKLMLEY